MSLVLLACACGPTASDDPDVEGGTTGRETGASESATGSAGSSDVSGGEVDDTGESWGSGDDGTSGTWGTSGGSTTGGGPDPDPGGCEATYRETGECPAPLCELGCGAGDDSGGCPAACLPVPCLLLPSETCPDSRCQTMTRCDGTEACFDLFTAPPPPCGEAGYYGQAVECCPGLERACAGEAPGSGQCVDDLGYQGFGICIECGDGECSSVEDHCNCPEDCAGP